MVNRLKKSTEYLEAPSCPGCHVDMRWFSSKLISDDPVLVIDHAFVCPICKRPERVQTGFAPTRVLPDKLSAPRFIATALQLRGAGFSDLHGRRVAQDLPVAGYVTCLTS